jgi:hypothetical protein
VKKKKSKYFGRQVMKNGNTNGVIELIISARDFQTITYEAIESTFVANTNEFIAVIAAKLKNQ